MSTVDSLEEISKYVRREVIKFKTASGHGHLASTLSVVDILVALYFGTPRYFNPQNDILVFGKAHGGPAIYPILSRLGFIDESELSKYCLPNGILRLHPDQSIPGCDFVGGSLGNALGYAAGRAFSERDRQFVVILGDAELYEGSIWEALLFISHNKLNNLLMIVDRNGLGTIGFTEELLALEPINQKFSTFGISAITVDGHNFRDLTSAYSSSRSQPTCIIANTIKARGVSFMEGKPEYHTKYPTDSNTVEMMLKGLE